jgi:hypothetical protein
LDRARPFNPTPTSNASTNRRDQIAAAIDRAVIDAGSETNPYCAYERFKKQLDQLYTDEPERTKAIQEFCRRTNL